MLSNTGLRFIFVSILFFGAGLAYHSFYKSKFTEESIGNQVSANLGKQLREIEIEAEILSKDLPDNTRWSQSPYSFFLVDSISIKAWSQNAFVPEINSLVESFEIKLFQSQRGDFLIRKWLLDNNHFLICVLPLAERFKVTNQYLRPQWNKLIFPIDGIRIISPLASEGFSIIVSAKCYFKIKVEESVEKRPLNLFSLILLAFAILFLLLGVGNWLLTLHRREQYGLVFVLSFLLLFAIRVTMIYGGFPSKLGYWEVFNPQRFASSSFNVSLGDFFLNSLVVLVCCTYLFLNYSKLKFVKYVLSSQRWMKLVFAILFLAIAFFSFLFPFLFFEIIFHNSAISLDIVQHIHFDMIRLLAFTTVLMGVISSFMICHFCVQIVSQILTSKISYFGSLLLGAGIFIIYFVFSNHNYWISLIIGFVYFSILFFSGWHSSLTKIGFNTFLYFIVAITAFSLQGTLSIKEFTREADIASQLRFGNNSLINHDILGEYLLAESGKKIAQDQFIQGRLMNPFLSKSIIKQRVEQIYINSYFDRYEVTIYLYNAAGEPLGDRPDQGFASSIEAFKEIANKTEYEGVYLVKEPKVRSIKRYLNIIPIYRSSLVGFVVMDISLKKIIPHSVYPELLVDNRFAQFIGNKDYSFAFFSNGELLTSFGSYNYDRDFDKTLLKTQKLFQNGFEENGYQHVGVRGEEDEEAIVSSHEYSWFYVLANFSFLFVIGLVSLLLWMMFYAINSLVRGYKLNYSARIQLYIYLAFIVPLIVVSVATLSITSQSRESQLKNDFQVRCEQIAQSIAPLLEESDVSSISRVTILETELLELAKSANADISVFNPMGELITSSQPAIFENQLASNWMDRKAWQRIAGDKETYVVQSEKIGTLQYNSSYLALKSSASGKFLGIVNLPFFKSADIIEKAQGLVLANILVVFVIVFILFSLISFYTVGWLTFPLRLITKTLGKTSFTGENKPLQWNSNDEIGLMASEYNRMLQNLEQSKAALARSQKETAWREMAQQVAHEIKNPLTPMKLILQQMELSMGKEVDKEKNSKSVKTLLEQVDILNGIASSFSSFAKMPAPVLSRVEIGSVLKRSAELYANLSNGKVNLSVNESPLFVQGDEQLLIRIFSNIILNGLQSGESEGMVNILLKKQAEKCIISFRDNGSGVDEITKQKMFTPYFSTKKSGSGLGLAIAKQGIEQCGGIIWFESQRIGTTFFIELPLA